MATRVPASLVVLFSAYASIADGKRMSQHERVTLTDSVKGHDQFKAAGGETGFFSLQNTTVEGTHGHRAMMSGQLLRNRYVLQRFVESRVSGEGSVEIDGKPGKKNPER